jgi:gluconolactonase
VTDEALQLDRSRCALIIQDLQNDVIIEGGAFAESGAPAHATAQNVVSNVADLAAACRSAGVPVIHIWYIVEPGAAGLKQNAPLFQGVKEADALVRGTWGAAPAEGLEPQDGDHIVEKMRMNGFYETRLDILLRGLGTETCSSAAPGRTCRSSTPRATAPTPATRSSSPPTAPRPPATSGRTPRSTTP